MLGIMKAMKFAQKARSKGGPRKGDPRARVAKDVYAQPGADRQPEAAREIWWISVEAARPSLASATAGASSRA